MTLSQTRSLLALKDSCITPIFLPYARSGRRTGQGLGVNPCTRALAEQPTKIQFTRSLVQIAEVPRRSPRPVRCSDCHIHVFVSIILLCT
jgi:hypothetical protein